MKRSDTADGSVTIPRLNLLGMQDSGKNTKHPSHKSSYDTPISNRSFNPHLKTESQNTAPAPPIRSMLNGLGRGDIGKSDYSKRLLYENEAIHKKYTDLQRNYNQLQSSLENLNDEYRSLKEAFVALGKTANKISSPTQQSGQGNTGLEVLSSDIEDVNDDTDDIDTVRMLLELESATKLRLMEEHRQLQSQLDSLRGESHLVTMRHSNIENVLRLERENAELRQIIKRMSEMMVGEGRAYSTQVYSHHS